MDDATASSCRVPGRAPDLVVEHACGQAQQGIGARAHCVAVAVRPADDTGEAARARVARLRAGRRSMRPAGPVSCRTALCSNMWQTPLRLVAQVEL